MLLCNTNISLLKEKKQYINIVIKRGLCTSSGTVIRLKAWMAASCTDRLVAGCLMHFVSTVVIAGLAASRASPMLPTTYKTSVNNKKSKEFFQEEIGLNQDEHSPSESKRSSLFLLRSPHPG